MLLPADPHWRQGEARHGLRIRRGRLGPVGLLLVVALAAGCSGKPEEAAGYQAACHGPPLGSVERRNAATEDGYSIDRRYDCIEKASFAAIEGQRIRWEAANTPEAIARRNADYAESRARSGRERTRYTGTSAASTSTGSLPEVVVRSIDANTASESDIASVISVGPAVARQIVAGRAQRRFSDWADLVRRVDGLGAALSAYDASTCGLNVDGKSLDGAPPDATMAALISTRHQRH